MHVHRVRPLRHEARGAAGFTILELMIVVSIIGVLAVLAIPALDQARRRSQNAAFVNDLRVLTDAGFEQYAMANGDYPENEPPGVAPPGIDEYLPREHAWTSVTPIGGQWDWDRADSRQAPLFGCYAGLSVVDPSRTSSQMAEIDKQIDDGNLDTGRFHRRTAGYIYVLE